MKKNLWFKRFKTFALATFVVIAVICVHSISTKRAELVSIQQANAQRMVDEVATMLDDMVFSLTESSQIVRTLPWITKLFPDSNYFQDTYFSTMRKVEIAKEFSAYFSGDLYAQSMILFFPYNDVAISKDAWTNVGRCLRMHQLPDALHLQVLNQMESFTELGELTSYQATSADVVLCVPLENTRAPRGYLVAVMDTARIATQVKRLSAASGNVMKVTLLRNQETAFSVQLGNQSVKGLVHANSRFIPSWRFELAYSSALSALGLKEFIYRTLLMCLVVYLLLCAVSWAVLYYLVVPIMRAISRVSPNSHSIRNFEQTLEKMTSAHNESLRQQALRQLIKGEADIPAQVVENQGTLYPPIVAENEYCRVLLLVGPKLGQATPEPLPDFAPVEGVRMDLVDTVNNEFVVLCFAKTPELISQQRQVITAAVQARSWLCFAGDVSTGLAGIALSYQRAKLLSIYAARGMRMNHYFPITWESQLIHNIREGNQQAVRQLMDEIQRENKHRFIARNMDESDYLRLFLSLDMCLQRLAVEIGMENEFVEAMLLNTFLTDDLDTRFDILQRAGLELCDAYARAAKVPTIHLGEQLAEYIEEHYANRELSLQMLIDHFGVNGNIINKHLRQRYGVTFYAYLTSIRMTAAKRLLEEGRTCVSDIASQCGYDNDVTFRRAFKNHMGVAPREWQQKEKDDENK